jgi:hypothetical protein
LFQRGWRIEAALLEAVLDIALRATGILLLLVVLVDALWTTLWVDGGGGPLSSRLTSWSWRGWLGLVGRERHRALSLFGPLALAFVVLLWVLLLWAGWTLLFMSSPEALTHAQGGPDPGWSGTIFFVAYSMFTMGNGDFAPHPGGWQVLTGVVAGSGMMLVTLGVTFLLSVIGAVVDKRAFASRVSGLGMTGPDIVLAAWDGRDLRALDLPLSGLSGQLAELTEQYLSYPILQYYHGARRPKSPALAIAALDDALTLIHFGVPAAQRPSPAVMRGARAAVATFLETLAPAFVEPAADVPAPPDLGRLHAAGIPTVDRDDFERSIDDLADRRRRLLGLVRVDGYEWPAKAGP